MCCIQSALYQQGPYHRIDHWHPTDQLLLVLEGEVKLQISGQLYQIRQPSVVFISHLETHSFLHTSEAYRRFVVDIIPSEASRQLRHWDRLMAPFLNRPEQGSHVFPVGDALPQLQMLFQLLCEDPQSGQAALLETILHYLFRKIPEAFPYRPDPVTGIVRQLQRQFDADPQAEESLEQLASCCHLSVSHLTHSFKQTTGYSIGQYRLRCRIARAKVLLTETQLPAGEVGIRCGFPDASNFSRYFRREVGLSPMEFRKKQEK